MILYTIINTEIGNITACSTSKGICFLAFADDNFRERELKTLEKDFGGPVSEGTNAHIENLRIELAEYFAGKLKEFTVPLDLAGTMFQKQVWRGLAEIKYGTTRSYMEQSIALGNPKSIRAVAHANGMNRIAILIPCHRVIGSDGTLTGYAGGLERKKWLLEHEKKNSGQFYEKTLF